MPLTQIPVLDELLNAHRSALGDDFTPYRNHTYRVVNLCIALFPAETAQLLSITRLDTVLQASSAEKVELAVAASRHVNIGMPQLAPCAEV